MVRNCNAILIIINKIFLELKNSNLSTYSTGRFNFALLESNSATIHFAQPD